MRTNIMNFLAVTALAAAALFAPAQAKADNGAWSVVDSSTANLTTTYGISMTTSGFTPALATPKITSAIDQVVKMGIVSGTGVVSAKGIMASNIGQLTQAQLMAAPSATIPAVSNTQVSGTTGGVYQTITNSNRYAGISYQVTVPASSQVDIYVTQFNGKAK